ncbi:MULTISPECIES: hypothetical protein [Acinetobacter]|uniref:hypothetical protein n=1 Tax=Acinetobacter TaxID=469 RepID=UPI00055413C6|nr:hypothetical protein [Acinetobacter sp. HR7]
MPQVLRVVYVVDEKKDTPFVDKFAVGGRVFELALRFKLPVNSVNRALKTAAHFRLIFGVRLSIPLSFLDHFKIMEK